MKHFLIISFSNEKQGDFFYLNTNTVGIKLFLLQNVVSFLALVDPNSEDHVTQIHNFKYEWKRIAPMTVTCNNPLEKMWHSVWFVGTADRHLRVIDDSWYDNPL